MIDPRRGARRHFALARASARAVLTYRLSFVLGLSGLLFQMLAMLSIWRVLLRSGTSVGGYTWPEMKAYLLVAYGTNALVGGFADGQLGWRIRDGMVAVDLVKPIGFQRARFAEAIGKAGVELFTIAVVCLGVILTTGGIAVPPAGNLALFAISALLVLPLNFCVVYLTGTLAFWTENTFGLSLARRAITNLFSGALIPLSFLPEWLRLTAMFLPFACVTSHPALIYLGRATGPEAFRLIAFQAGWVVALWFGCRLLWWRGVRQLTVHGG